MTIPKNHQETRGQVFLHRERVPKLAYARGLSLLSTRPALHYSIWRHIPTERDIAFAEDYAFKFGTHRRVAGECAFIWRLLRDRTAPLTLSVRNEREGGLSPEPLDKSIANTVKFRHSPGNLMLNFQSPSEFSDELTQLYLTGHPPGSSTGWPSLDPHLTIAPGYWTAITGIPSEGKSTFIDNLMVNLMHPRRGEWKFVVFSAETQPPSVYLANILETCLRKPFRAKFNNRMEPAEILKVMNWLDNRLIICTAADDDTTGFRLPTMNSLMGVAEDMLKEQWKDWPRVGVILDPWNEMDHTPIDGMNETQMTNHELALWRQWIRKMGNVHGFIVAHPSKPQKDREGNFKPVTLYDISGSSAWKNKCDNGVVIRRPSDMNMEVDVEKVRMRHHGKAGKTFLRFNWGVNHLYEHEDGNGRIGSGDSEECSQRVGSEAGGGRLAGTSTAI